MKDVVKKTNISLGASSIADSTESSLFGGTLFRNNNLTSKFSYSSQYSFASHDEVFRLKFLRLNADIALLRQCLSQTFLEDLENYYPDQFVEAYGTHVLCDVSIGGRLSMIYRSLIYTETSSTAKTRIIKSGFNATIPKILSFNTSSDSEVTVTEIDTKKNEDWSLFVQSSGGRAINSTYTPADGVPTIDLGAWQNSITERNAALVDIAWDKAIPIYELISDLNKREQIKQAVIRYIEKRKIDVLPVTPVYRSFSGWDHLYQSWYSPTYGEKEDWKYEGAYFSIFTKQISGTVPLCQYYGYGDHFYTTDYDLNGTSGRRFECIIGYVYPEAHEGAIPLYRAWNGKDHFYTTEYSPTYGDKKDYKYELIACYVLPLTD